MRSIKSLPRTQRPQEKLLASGSANVTIEELIAIILGTGSDRRNAKQLAHHLLTQFQEEFTDLSPKQLLSIRGIGPTKACRLVAALELGKRYHAPNTTRKILQPTDILAELDKFRRSHREQCRAFYLNARYERISSQLIAVGTLNTQYLEARDVFAPAVTLPCRHIILVHNHPSNNIDPSHDDIEATHQLQKAGKLLGVELLDHLIVTRQSYLSFREQGLL